MAAVHHVPEHLSTLADVLGPDVDIAILEKLHVISDGNLNRAINHFYEGTYHNATIPAPTRTQAPAPANIPQPYKKTTPNSSRDTDLILEDLSENTSGSGSCSVKRKAYDSIFPKYLGELTIIAFALGGIVKIEAGEQVIFDRAKPNPQHQFSRKKKGSGSATTGWGGKALKENNVVRFTKQNGFEIGRLQIDTSRWVSKLMDYGLAEFQGTIILAPPILQTGAEIVLSMRCYLTAAAFTSFGSNQNIVPKSKSGSATFVNEALETGGELELKYRKYAVNAMFRDLALAPVATNTICGPRDRGIEIFSSTPEGSTQALNGENEENESEPEVSDKELDVLYEKAQQHGREFAPMDPPSTMTYILKPYQREALAWMHCKENQGESSEKHKTLHPLWEEYEFAKEDGYEPRSEEPKRYYFNPYSSEMSLEFPTSDQRCRGGILADEMGLGKTIEILSLVHANSMDRATLDSPEEAFARLSTSNTQRRKLSPTTLIVCPMSLISQWRDEAINSSDGSLKVEVYYGDSRDWSDVTLVQKNAPDVLITSYGTVMSEFSSLTGGQDLNDNRRPTSLEEIKAQNIWKKGSALFNVEFHRVVLDEAHQIKSRLTKTAKACYAINSVRRWVVTGTPIQNKLEDLFSLVHFLRAEPWSNFSFWRTFITIPFESKDKDKAMKVITSVLEPLVLRRTKTTKDENGNPIVMLPERTVEIEYLQFSEQENDIYQALFKDGKTKFNHYCRAGTVLRHYASIFQLLMRMRQVCDHPLLVVGRNKPTNSSEGGIDLKDGPIQLEELMAKFSADGDQKEQTFGASVLQNLMSNTGEVPECPVCFEDMADGVLMPCMHAACRSCVLDYLQLRDDRGEKGECPVCRQGPITEADLIEYSTSDATEQKNEDFDTKCSDIAAGNVLMAEGVKAEGNGDSGNSNGGRVVQIRRNNFKSSAKLDALMQDLIRVRKTEPDAKSVIFSQFTGMLDLIESILVRDGFQFLRLDGTHSQATREKTLQSFKAPDHPASVILISLRAGGVGLNLTAASRVYMMDPWWNYAIESQAIDRVHRIGQTKPVVVKRFIIQDSVEEKILGIQSRKNALASGLGMTKMEAQSARMEDLQEIFS
ncbi:SNF2 family N-terminal domain-containing protein [Gamsiella multidivaricata]|uniref:SNF2 family N-terminal domain-containing protein n=1 Tax=Gamsiella multidivaricata TaxID=101098 RepID=UPI0022205838|nr:SNF2 family N-terminal domain-containing protein [Gamsiella multidivaricata]KAG0362349.1 DNA helicase rad5 [Gamsiella multidivaricata]KAI7824391.1 SNF2 family N-terminal domain-containing protein [Gamsiella multidivaricata]